MFARVWRKVVLFGRLLAACRFSLISVVAGFLLLFGVVQAQNLFADLAFSNTFAQISHWIGFLLAVFFLWAWPVHYGARRILKEPHWLVPVAVRRTLSDAELTALQDELRTELGWAIRWTPRVLGLVPFIAVGFGLYFCDASMDTARDLDEVKRAQSQILWIALGDAVAAVLFIVFVIGRRLLLARIERQADLRASDGAAQVRRRLTRFARASLFFTFALFLVAYAAPHRLAYHFDRALLIPLLFGSLVLVFRELSRRGNDKG
jgi:hypothetical protein